MIDKVQLDNALKNLGSRYLKEPFRSRWTEEYPTTGYCYFVSEVICRYCCPECKSYYLIDDDNEKHWYVKTPTGEIIDLTADQYDEKPDYSKGKRKSFRKESNTCKELATQLGLKPKTE